MDSKSFSELFWSALESPDLNTYLSEKSQTTGKGGENPETIRKIYEIAHMSVKDLLSWSGMTNGELSRRFCIPIRTVQNWAIGMRECPAYVRLMMAELLGYIDVPKK